MHAQRFLPVIAIGLLAAGILSNVSNAGFFMRSDLARGQALIDRGEITEGVSILKQVADDSSYPARDRARALEKIAWHYHKTRDSRIAPILFVGMPYEQFYREAKNEREAYNHVFEYAASLYPLPISSYRTAQMYAEGMLHNDLPPDVRIEHEKRIHDAVSRAEEELSANPHAYPRYSMRLRRAELAATLYRAGYRDENPEHLYQYILAASSQNKDLQGFVVLHYASFLANTAPDTRREDIITLLSRFYGSDEFVHTNIFGFFRNIRDVYKDTNPGLIHLAGLDPAFKTFLEDRFQWRFDDQ